MSAQTVLYFFWFFVVVIVECLRLVSDDEVRKRVKARRLDAVNLSSFKGERLPRRRRGAGEAESAGPDPRPHIFYIKRLC